MYIANGYTAKRYRDATFQPNENRGTYLQFSVILAGIKKPEASMKRLVVLVALLAAGALSITAVGYKQPSQGLTAAALAATQLEKVKDNLYMITG